MLGKKVSQEHDMPVASGTEPETGTPPNVAAAQRKLHVLQWVVPALTGSLVILTAFAGEQQRASEVHKGALRKLLP
jgi:hypothetical protein